MPLHSIDLFSGVGGITLALQGITKPLLYCEIDPNCRQVLQKHINQGTLPKAPIFSDVRKLGSTSVSKTTRKQKVDIIVGGWPCQDLSTLGLRRGLDGEKSGLIYEVFRLVDEFQPNALFLENVPPVVNNGLSQIINELCLKRGFYLRWLVLPASALGAPHLRRRWFCLAYKNEVFTKTCHSKSYKPFDWSKETVPRMLLPVTKNERKLAHLRASMMGNAVVPDAVRAAFIILCSGFGSDVLETKPLSRLFSNRYIQFNKTVENVHLFENNGLPFWGFCYHDKIFKVLKIPDLQKPALNLVFDPQMFQGSPSGNISAELITQPIYATAWSTPRQTSHTSHVLTRRTWRDLPSQVRFERGTDDATRGGTIHPQFVEWLMGYPKNWTLI